MKLLPILIFLLPITVVGQSKADYENAMTKFQKFYNTGQGDSIFAMFGHLPDDMKKENYLWKNDQIALHHKEYGKLKSFKFIGVDDTDPNKVYVFKTVFSKAGVKTTSLTLYNDLTLGTFRFITTSERITELLKKPENSR